jgi:hypothetical protein
MALLWVLTYFGTILALAHHPSVICIGSGDLHGLLLGKSGCQKAKGVA